MKRLIMLCGVFCLALSMQAASFDWASGYMFSEGVDEANFESASFKWALIDLGTSSDASGITFAGGTLSGATAAASGSGATYEGVEGTYSSATAGNYYTLAIYETGSDMWGLGGVVQATLNPTDDTGNTLMDVGFSNAPDPYGWGETGITASGSGGGVPEPTSGLLLLFGGALLALRRKRA